MLFNSWPFILGFLPPVLAGWWLFASRESARLWFLLGASVVFYGYWDWRYAPLLVATILVNWLAVQAYFSLQAKTVLVAAIAGNLLCLALFKYLGFFTQIWAQTTGWQVSAIALALPLGISFFTFHHIIYLADLMRGKAPRYSFRDFALYIALFPQILAGPLVRHNEIVHQFRNPPDRPGFEERLARGIALFLIGLGKKIVLADALAALADPIFARAGHVAVTVGEAWTAALAFPFQIYFDFSGYSDMAIGLALMLGFTLPVNFNTPYRATSLREFWQRWHMTLSRFLRDYLYIPLGGNRHGLSRQIQALLATMALGGLWHGAGWTFVVWGVLHGIGLSVGVLWRRWGRPLPAVVGWGLLAPFLIVTWIVFRAPSLAGVWDILTAMAGQAMPGPVAKPLTIAAAAAVAIIGPNSQQIVERLRPYGWLAPAGALATILALLKLGDGPAYEFIYFRF